MTAERNMRDDEKQVIVPLHAEEFAVAKRRIITGRALVSTVTRRQEELVEELLAHERVEIERTPIGKPLEHPPAIREEGDTIIVPVVEEELVVQRRLVLKEEIRVRRVRETERHQERVTLRRQEAAIMRFPAQEPAAAEPAAGVEQQTARKEK
ncbi:MAG TPA: DUF2382 domain-containing protein [Candidatus Angelobacter sp.]